ncbi:glycoside hydrolase family 5 protein [Sphingomonas sp. LB-2]|uniref:glycoside hydrolase family 5 protein n=1 Tax=Sphingomonas caeni TaxID=2984949 RepID=UPI00222FA823|nr:glycoside hydrolase family 5 protein [Sphingomonas caeni]MCW3847471.1 glycoside hydrolase family 5 protein [Sphingomonas caeni]
MRFITLIAAALALLLPAAAGAQRAGPAWETAAHMKRGVNIIGYDPLWRDPAKARFQTRHFGIIKAGGFDFVRVVLSGFRHMDADNKLSPQFFATLDWVVKEAGAAGLGVILDEHDFTYCAANADPCETKLIAFWQQMGEHYKAAPKSVLFELLNEPNGQLDAPRWNAMIAKVLPVVRATNPNRTVVIGPVRWNNLGELPNLVLPKADRNIIVTFHSYEPFGFTHQGAPWAEGMKDVHGVPFTAADEARIAGDYDKVQAWSKAEDRPILMGEFGAYDRSGTPIEDRARYTATVRREAEKRGFLWAYWQFDSDFVLWDMAKDQWVEPIRKALIPEG